MQAVVLAAGKGTRLRPLTDDKPKVLVEVNGTPMVEDVFDNLIDAGATELVVVVGYKAEQIIDRYGDEYRDVPITYTHQREQLGLAHAILQAEPHVDGDLMLMLGDNVFRGNLPDVTNRQQEDPPKPRFSPRRCLPVAENRPNLLCCRGGSKTGLVVFADSLLKIFKQILSVLG
jgi:glucose-1-phosphate thymidylyltransferase